MCSGYNRDRPPAERPPREEPRESSDAPPGKIFSYQSSRDVNNNF